MFNMAVRQLYTRAVQKVSAFYTFSSVKSGGRVIDCLSAANAENGYFLSIRTDRKK